MDMNAKEKIATIEPFLKDICADVYAHIDFIESANQNLQTELESAYETIADLKGKCQLKDGKVSDLKVTLTAKSEMLVAAQKKCNEFELDINVYKLIPIMKSILSVLLVL